MSMTGSAFPMVPGYHTLSAFKADFEECAGWLSIDYRGGGSFGQKSRGYRGLALIEAPDPEVWIRFVPDGWRCPAELSLNAGVATELQRYPVLGLVFVVVSPANLATESTRISHH